LKDSQFFEIWVLVDEEFLKIKKIEIKQRKIPQLQKFQTALEPGLPPKPKSGLAFFYLNHLNSIVKLFQFQFQKKKKKKKKRKKKR